MKFTTDIEKLLPFGYLFLVILGIFKESILYYQLGINILKYSNIMDILISPVADITYNPIVLGGFIIFGLLLYFVVFLMSKNYKSDFFKKLFGTKTDFSNLPEEEAKSKFGDIYIIMLAIGMLSFFLGIGIGSGKAIAEKNDKGTLKYTTVLTFNSNETEEVYLIGSNSANIFYYKKGNKNAKISPIPSIKSIEIQNKNSK